MLQQETADDYAIGTGTAHSVRDLVQIAFECVDLDYEEYVRTEPGLARPAEIEEVVADPGKARESLGWQAKVSFEELVDIMVQADLRALSENKQSG
jgi:GDPmannose 4,6-dehydratase